ncbi:MAG: type II toxin-antitoxin system PemK/MazF family toxin [Rhizobiaceae bacterium]|nr:type II toxin-antitoxin system PemK/MazF family toxin [Rhizobiaceae bacterium]
MQFPPVPGQVLICDYQTGFREPEMVKERLVVVVSPRLPYRDGLCTVVPLSQTPPRSGLRYQCKIELPYEAPKPYEGSFKFAKADMLATVAFRRLSMPYTGRDPVSGKRRYLKMVVDPIELRKVRTCLLHALGLDHLTGYL